MECLEAASRDSGSSTLSSVSALPLLLTIKIMLIFPCGSSVLEQVGSIQQKQWVGFEASKSPNSLSGPSPLPSSLQETQGTHRRGGAQCAQFLAKRKMKTSTVRPPHGL